MVRGGEYLGRGEHPSHHYDPPSQAADGGQDSVQAHPAVVLLLQHCTATIITTCHIPAIGMPKCVEKKRSLGR